MQGNTRNQRTFEKWFADCSSWWDMTRGEEAYDHPDLEWRRWYEEGLTVEEAVRRAERRVFGR
jgi:hypothetical protein